MISTTLQVALGGALGAALRFLLGTALLRPGFPIGILSVNVIGSFLMGLLVVWLHQRGLAGWQPFLMTGVLGGFTTFSAFSLETMTLIERGAAAQALAYVALSVGLAVGALALGVWLARATA
ncbi:fluoride efflux transporter CrcB [Jannaschia ovalis]|uniref:Fluoride-specific ion channel FluC n=1 Tax=Jannaschia ovalis TaxID=3038773 RepID=A0ABY8LG40_9RHOB|nr:fluoride efflux transporter CrcB [Jannaschia sp. GRR-S6-38]WGH79124.1 fluoride efflux transporter CrcB [Jannaschia sp. GRR-S6-38]